MVLEVKKAPRGWHSRIQVAISAGRYCDCYRARRISLTKYVNTLEVAKRDIWKCECSRPRGIFPGRYGQEEYLQGGT